MGSNLGHVMVAFALDRAIPNDCREFQGSPMGISGNSRVSQEYIKVQFGRSQP